MAPIFVAARVRRLSARLGLPGRGGHTWAVLGNHAVNHSRLDAVDDVVACSGDKVPVAADLNVRLRKNDRSQFDSGTGTWDAVHTLSAYFSTRLSYCSSLSQARILRAH